MSHLGKPCDRNTKHGPAVAEEYAMEKIAQHLLIDLNIGKIRPDDEAILGRQTITDGDTKGSKRLIEEQASIIPEFALIAEYFLDIEYSINLCLVGFISLQGHVQSCVEYLCVRSTRLS